MLSVTNRTTDLLNGNHSEIIDLDTVSNEEAKVVETLKEEPVTVTCPVVTSTKKQINVKKSLSKIISDSKEEMSPCNSYDDNSEIRKFLSNGNSSVSIFTKSVPSDISNTNSSPKPVSSVVGKVLILGNRNSSLSTVDNVQGGKFFLLNNSVFKNSTENDCDSIDCSSQQLNNIVKQYENDEQLKTVVVESDLSLLDNLVKDTTKQMKTRKPRKTVVKENGNLKTVPSYVQISPNSLRPVRKTIKVNAPTSKSFDPSRNKVQDTTDNLDSVSQNSINSPDTMNNGYKVILESPAIVEARNEVARCKKKLIEVALHRRVHEKLPLPGFIGKAYSCEECDDSFLYEENYKKHKDRRCALFTYACPVCKKTLEFYNRCVFLLHVRSHDTAVKACFLTISVIPANKLNFQVVEDDDIITNNDASAVSSVTAFPSTVPVIRRKIFIKSADKRSEAPAVRIVKPIILPRSVSSPTTDTEADSKVTEVDTSTQVNKEEVSSSEKLSSGSDKSSIDNGSPVNKISIMNENLPNLKTEIESKGQSLPIREKPNSSKVTVDDEKKVNSSPKVSVKIKSPSVNDEITMTSSDEEEEAEAETLEVENKSKMVSCRECGEEVPNLTIHYRGENHPKTEYQCNECNYFNPTKCALSAHLRIHSKSQPYVCPDCGYFFSTLGSFSNHMKLVCYYDFKTIRVKCPECSVLKQSVPQFSDHFILLHTKDVFKCGACTTSSNRRKIVEMHIEKSLKDKNHKDRNVTTVEGHWCTLCPNVLVAKGAIRNHVDKHASTLQYLRYVYICKHCKKFATGRMIKFADHYQNNCPAMLVPSKIPKTKKVKMKIVRGQLLNPMHNNSPAVQECLEKDPLSVEEWEADKLKAEFLPKTKVCVMCRSAKVNENSLFCHDCVRFVDAEDQNETTSNAGGPLVTQYSGRSKRKYKCKLCKELMNRDWVVIKKHFELFHQSDFDVGSKSRGSNSDLNSSTNSNTNRKRKSSAVVATKTAEKIPKTADKNEKGEFKYKCAVCSVGHNDRLQFHDHILAHKSETNFDYQCMECGLCFIVKSTLVKHLIVEHKIRERELNDYFKEYGMEVEETEEEERKLVENQCDVCFIECGTKSNYDRHIRTHGMAFVARQSKAKS